MQSFDRVDRWRGVGSALLTGNRVLLTLLGLGLAVWGAYAARLLLLNPEELARTENHPAWTHMYLIAELWSYGLPMEELQREYEETSKTTLEAARAAADKYAEPEKATLLLVGDLAKIEPGVKELKLGEIVVLDVEGKPVKR